MNGSGRTHPLPSWATPLAGVEGVELTARAPLRGRTTLRVGGVAELLAVVRSREALAAVVQQVRAHDVPFEVIGLGSNLLVPDDGLPGLVCRLDGEFQEFEIRGNELVAGAGVALPKLARATCSAGLLGLEALSGFPSTVGGAVVMNAGCYGTEIRDVLIDCECIDARGELVRFTVDELEPGYRSTRLQQLDLVVASARFRLEPGDADAAMARIDELNKKRWKALPSGRPTAGSVFRNPDGDYAGRLIEECGLRGHRLGGAAISVEHANVITNEDGATAEDVLGLMVEAFLQVRQKFGVQLEPEVVLTGSLRRAWWERTGSAPRHARRGEAPPERAPE